MSSSGYLVPPSQDDSQEKLWVETWKRLDRFLPDMRKELELDETKGTLQPVAVEQQPTKNVSVGSESPVS